MGLLSMPEYIAIQNTLCFYAEARVCGIKHIVIHPFLDGRDTLHNQHIYTLNNFKIYIDKYGGIIGSMHGVFTHG
jgi:bisphosphoglycerate-independent phosphoglycerate mutase (AlkP superfamily)